MKLAFTLLFVLCLSSAAYATPPRDLKLSYSNGALTVAMKHNTINMRKHYIRNIEVSVNGGEIQAFRYTFQKYPSEMEVLLPITLKPGDHVVVKAECKEGGSAQAEMDIFAQESTSAESAAAEGSVGEVPAPVAAEAPDTSVTTPYGK